jgi:hypothetical protein
MIRKTKTGLPRAVLAFYEERREKTMEQKVERRLRDS